MNKTLKLALVAGTVLFAVPSYGTVSRFSTVTKSVVSFVKNLSRKIKKSGNFCCNKMNSIIYKISNKNKKTTKNLENWFKHDKGKSRVSKKQKGQD